VSNAHLLLAAIKRTNLAYLWNRTDGQTLLLKKARKFQTHGSFLKGEFIRCLVGQTELPAGTEVLAFEHKRISYSEMVWIGDECYPAKGATVFTTGSDWTLVTLIEQEGQTILCDAYISTEPTERKAIGKVGD
jgi:hypothetical protein